MSATHLPPERLPLRGVHVLDCSRVLAGPFATMLLADLGADVIKVESVDGDETRHWGPPYWGDPEELRSAYFASVNRGKRSLVLDLKHADGQEVLDRLAARSDLIVHNFRPETAERLGLGAARLAERHPRLVTVVVGGFPGDRTERARPVYDVLAQAVSGLMAVNGDPEGPPTKVGVAVLDLLAGLEAAVGGLAALLGAGRGNAPRQVEVSLVEVGVASLVNVLANHLASGREPERHGNQHPNIVPYGPLRAGDGEIVVAVGNDEQFRRLLRVLELEDPDGRYATNPARVAQRDTLIPWLQRATARWGRAELVLALQEADVPAGPVNAVSDAVAQMARAHDGAWLEEVDGIRLPPDPVRLDGLRTPVDLPPPLLGEHTDAILAEAGLSREEIERLREAGIIDRTRAIRAKRAIGARRSPIGEPGREEDR